MKIISPRSARVLEAIYFTSPFVSLPFVSTSSIAESFHSSSSYASLILKMPMATVEERRMIRLMLPLNDFEESGVRARSDGVEGGETYGALMADFKMLTVPSTAGRMISVRQSQGG